MLLAYNTTIVSNKKYEKICRCTIFHQNRHLKKKILLREFFLENEEYIHVTNWVHRLLHNTTSSNAWRICCADVKATVYRTHYLVIINYILLNQSSSIFSSLITMNTLLVQGTHGRLFTAPLHASSAWCISLRFCSDN